jgi:hypothetical protein
MVSIVCPSCHTRFSYGAWSNHLTQTSNPLCCAIYDEQQSYIPGITIPECQHSSGASSSKSFNNPNSQTTLHEDFFDYGQDTGVDHTDNRQDFLSDEESACFTSESNSDSGSESSTNSYWLWTQDYHPLNPLSVLPETEPESSIADDMDDEQGHLLNHTEHQRLEDSIWVKPIIDIYPGQDVGKAYSKDIYLAYYDYENQLHGQLDNLYAPFLSKMDWEFARWSKLQGPGSTSASELMAIDSVCLNFQQISCL